MLKIIRMKTIVIIIIFKILLKSVMIMKVVKNKKKLINNKQLNKKLKPQIQKKNLERKEELILWQNIGQILMKQFSIKEKILKIIVFKILFLNQGNINLPMQKPLNKLSNWNLMNLPIKLFIQDNGTKEKDMDQENSIGLMDHIIMDTGKKIW